MLLFVEVVMRRLLSGFLLVGLLAGCGLSPAVPVAPAARAQAQATSGFQTLAGQPVTLASLRGRPVALSFLQPDQGDSEAQLPLIIRLASAYQAEGVAWVVAGEGTSLAALRQYAAAHGLTMLVWADLQGQELARRQFSSTPAHQFLDREGHVVKAHEGFMSRGELLEGLAAITR